MSGTISTASLLLDPSTWDLTLDSNNNLAVAQYPYSIAQDVACAVKTFLGEVYYNTAIGVPYFQQILGMFPPTSLVKAQIEAAALTVPYVATATCIITGFGKNRQFSGQIQAVDTNYAPLDVVQF